MQAEGSEHGEAGDHDQRDPLWCPARQHVDPTRATSILLHRDVVSVTVATQPPPRAGTPQIGRLPAPVYLVEAAPRSPRMRARIEQESPEPLRKRNVFAPSSYLEIV